VFLAQGTPTQTIPTGPAGMDNESVDAIEGSTAIILKAIPKTSKVEKFRFNSCLYPSCAKLISCLQSTVLKSTLPSNSASPASTMDSGWPFLGVEFSASRDFEDFKNIIYLDCFCLYIAAASIESQFAGSS
jgi:hypothetical protein